LYVDLILLNDDLFSFCVDLILLYIDLILTSPYPFRPIYWKDIHAKEDEAGLLKKDLFMEAVEAMENSGTYWGITWVWKWQKVLKIPVKFKSIKRSSISPG